MTLFLIILSCLTFPFFYSNVFKNIGFVFVVLILLVNAKPSRAQMIYDTLQLLEMEIVSNQIEQNKTTKTKAFDSLTKSFSRQENLSALLADNSVVFIKSYGRGGLATASFRGTAASHTQVLWNGFRIASPMLGQVDLSLVPNTFFDEAKLQYGGSSLEFIPGALGGSIELETRPQETAPMLSLSQMAGSYQTYITTAALNLKTGKFISNTRFVFQSSENDFDYYNNAVIPAEWMKQENASVQNLGFSQQFTYLISNTQHISLTSWNQWNDRNIPATMTNVSKGGNPEEYQNDFFSRNVLSWNYHRNKTRIQASGAWFHEELQYFLETSEEESTDTLIDSRNTSNGYFAKAKIDREFGKGFLFSSGLDFRWESVNTTNYKGLKQRVSAGLFARLEKTFWQRLTLDLLLRQELTDGAFLPLMPFFGLNYRLLPSADFNVRASISRNYHLPSLNDLYWVPGGNEELKPENAFEIEGGLNYRKAFSPFIALDADVSLFASQIYDWIQWKPGNYQYWTPENIAEVYARGLEASLQLKGTITKFSNQFRANYAFTLTTD
jgi:iron complex outermembrane receptor protein